MVLLGGLVFICLICMAAALMLASARKDDASLVVFLAAVLFLVISLVIMRHVSIGYPITDIAAGQYNVRSVDQDGDNVSVDIVLRDDNGSDHRVYYQFDKSAFEGLINHNAKKLVVTQAGNFKKLKLE